jgi:membrane-bound serine protease (ClpP class)
MPAMRRIWLIVSFAFLVVTGVLDRPVAAQTSHGPIYIARVDGPVTSVTIGYLERALHLAEAAQADALIISLSSSGGVLRDMRPFADEIAKARVPVVVYVAPEGTQSGAAGALFLSAAHISAMAPNTSFGSPAPLTQVDTALTQQTRDLVLDSVTKQIHDWNAARGRNTDWVDRAVREGALLNNEQAISAKPPAVDLVVANLDELLTQLDGRVVKLEDGRSVPIATLGRATIDVAPTLWEQLRLALSNPTLAFTLLVLGALAIYLELSAPGTSIFIGIGIVLILAAAAGLLVLPIRWGSLLLLLFALGLIGAEFFVPTHGALAITGLALVTVSALTLIDPAQAPGTVVAVWAILLVVLALASFAAFGIWLAIRNRGRPVATGQESMIGKLAEVRQRLEPEGMVFIDGALWRAISEDGAVEPGDWVRVSAIHELRLIVRRIDTERDA